MKGALWGLFLVFVVVSLFVLNFFGMILYSYQAVNAPKHQLLYLLGAVWSTYWCYYTSSVLLTVHTLAKKAMEEDPK